jgi:RNA 3'-terminal phosphate cyclase (ATP)
LASGGPVGEHLADQLLLPLALSAGGEFRTGRPSQHTLTNRDIIERFLGKCIVIDMGVGASAQVKISGQKAV